MHYLITGHTGFKGSWLTLLLTELGHEVSGFSLDPVPNSLFELAELSNLCHFDIRGDLRERNSIVRALDDTNADVVIHLAAQPFVRESYKDPRGNFETNVNGTLNLLEATSGRAGIKAQLIITTDKVYRNSANSTGYVEGDPLGGIDPYSASKSMADILTTSWVGSFPSPYTCIARAGNVIGGGDVGKDRLVPDVLSALSQKRPILLRNPKAVRPWQHVLDCLTGYLALIDAMLTEPKPFPSPSSWNFGPLPKDFATVAEVVDMIIKEWGEDVTWRHSPDPEISETQILSLNSEKSRNILGWKENLDLQSSIALCVDWRKSLDEGLDPRNTAFRQLREYLDSLC